MKINEYFEEQYLHAGNTYDNFVFENCPREFLSIARRELSKDFGQAKPCVVYLTKEMSEKVEGTLINFSELLQQKILARDFITAMIAKEALKHIGDEKEAEEFVDSQLEAFLCGDWSTVKDMHAKSFMPFEIREFSQLVGTIELVFILEDMASDLLQQAINIFVSSREPYSVKIFTNCNRLATYYDLNGVLIQNPHDYMRRDVNQFIEQESIEKE